MAFIYIGNSEGTIFFIIMLHDKRIVLFIFSGFIIINVVNNNMNIIVNKDFNFFFIKESHSCYNYIKVILYDWENIYDIYR